MKAKKGGLVPLRDAFAELDDDFYRDFPSFPSLPMVSMEDRKKLFNEPLIHVSEKEGNAMVRAELPGLEKNDFSVKVSDDGVELRVQRKQKREERSKHSYEFEGRFQGYSRYVGFPKKVEAKKAKMDFKNGVLHVTAPISKK